jgi:hypothetical protein
VATSFVKRCYLMATAIAVSRNARIAEQERQRLDPNSFSRTGGVRLDSFNATWPLARLSGNKDSLHLWCPVGVFSLNRLLVFPRSCIRRLSKYRGLFSTGLRIEHTLESFPAFIVFWDFGFPKLKSELARLGYDVED